MNRRDFVKIIGAAGAITLVPTMVIAMPTTLEDMDFVKQDTVYYKKYSKSLYTRADGQLSIYDDSPTGGDLYITFQPYFSCFQRWGRDCKDYSEVIRKVCKDIGGRYTPRSKEEQVELEIWNRGYRPTKSWDTLGDAVFVRADGRTVQLLSFKDHYRCKVTDRHGYVQQVKSLDCMLFLNIEGLI